MSRNSPPTAGSDSVEQGDTLEYPSYTTLQVCTNLGDLAARLASLPDPSNPPAIHVRGVTQEEVLSVVHQVYGTDPSQTESVPLGTGEGTLTQQDFPLHWDGAPTNVPTGEIKGLTVHHTTEGALGGVKFHDSGSGVSRYNSVNNGFQPDEDGGRHLAEAAVQDEYTRSGQMDPALIKPSGYQTERVVPGDTVIFPNDRGYGGVFHQFESDPDGDKRVSTVTDIGLAKKPVTE